MTVKSLLINEADRPAQRAGSPLLESAISPENPIYQGDLAGTADTAGDVSTRNDSATARADTGNIRGICSPGVPAAEAAEDRLDKIEAMVTDLFRQLRNDRAVRQVLYDRINEIDSFPLRNMLLRIGTGEEFGRAMAERLDRVESLKPFIVAAHERLDAVDTWRNQTSARIDEMAEQKATITDVRQIHNRINGHRDRLDEVNLRGEAFACRVNEQGEAIDQICGNAERRLKIIENILVGQGWDVSTGKSAPAPKRTFEVGKSYRTRGGDKATIEDIGIAHAGYMIGRVNDNPHHWSWLMSGRINERPDVNSPMDLLPGAIEDETKPPPKRTIKGAWVNVYDSPASEGGRYFVRPFLSREQADDAAAKGVAPRLACIQIPDITEGEGL